MCTIHLTNQVRRGSVNIALGLGKSIPVAALLLSIQLVAHDVMELLLAMLAGAVVLGAALLAHGARSWTFGKAPTFEFPIPLRPMAPFQLMSTSGS